ncbi:NAD(P)/FAD-dependent oxidoreductase [bacterium]|nr:MAG: NAD(P)/FAD-dependent oxidoreductase [bacterium]
MALYDIAVVGAGPAGAMSAIRAGRHNKAVALIERNNAIGKKILLSGRGRCNVTNIAPLSDFIVRFGRQGEFLRTAFSKFFNQELIDFFKVKGLELKIERQGRVFPVTDKAISIVEVLKIYLQENKTACLYNKQVIEIKKDNGLFRLFLDTKEEIVARKVILASGGMSFRATGSTGDGFVIAKKLGHSIAALMPGLVPLRAKESWVKELQGLTLKNIRFTLRADKKKIVSNTGELLFTHFGVSGPLVLDLSSEALDLLKGRKEIRMNIDLKPGLSPEQLENRLVREFRLAGNKNARNIMKEILPLRFIKVFLNLAAIDSSKQANQITQAERRKIIDLLKLFSLHIVGSLPIEEAMVTCGGVSIKEINPRTMESRIVPGLYFCGEIIDASAPSGGYNLQQAFSTGYLAGESAAE